MILLLLGSIGAAAQEAPPEPTPADSPAPVTAPESAAEPALPPGLAGPDGESPRDQPEEATEPELPAGLGAGQEPALPGGLGDEPALPSGLGEDPSPAPAPASKGDWMDRVRLLWEARYGSRLDNDPAQRDDLTLLETRLQLAAEKAWSRHVLEARVDLLADGLESGLESDLRQLRWTWRASDALDLQVGRQILTWGTGDLLFINDLFPKDWQSFLLGRKTEYLKAPSDALRLGWFTERGNVEIVYTPQFDPDRFITGERLSFFDPASGSRRGRDQRLRTAPPDDLWQDDEIALRLSDGIGSWEVALYGYSGFWKSPAGFDPNSGRATFPRLAVWGASARGPWGRGIASFEAGWYDSRDDADGGDPTVANGELRALAGYELELGRELTGGLQLYAEQLLDHDAYRRTLPAGVPARDETRLLVTVRLTQRLRQQTVRLSLFTFWSPTDEDAYLRPRLEFDLGDRWRFELGGNLFLGTEPHTFFGQFEDNSSLYTAWRYAR
ncbi:MAG: hypothetical protein AAF604_17720 [Acidobacteriota bacterium]